MGVGPEFFGVVNRQRGGDQFFFSVPKGGTRIPVGKGGEGPKFFHVCKGGGTRKNWRLAVTNRRTLLWTPHHCGHFSPGTFGFPYIILFRLSCALLPQSPWPHLVSLLWFYYM